MLCGINDVLRHPVIIILALHKPHGEEAACEGMGEEVRQGYWGPCAARVSRLGEDLLSRLGEDL